jgi:hypothetical protein
VTSDIGAPMIGGELWQTRQLRLRIASTSQYCGAG